MARIDRLFHELVNRKGSDLHLTSGQPPRIRLDGSMQSLPEDPIDRDGMVALLREIAPESCWTEFTETRDTDFAYEIPGLARFRANFFRDLHGPGAVFRVIPSKILSAEELGLSEAILSLCRLPKGLVLVTGPTGSGKSTTLCAMVDYINRTRDDHIITIEDPIEFVHPSKRCLINQREVRTHTESFKRALRAALREDPDIILVGELRDLETVAIALEMAETGHLVFGTLHTTTAAQTVDRLVDQFPADQQEQIRVMLATTLKGVIAQTLLKKKSGRGRVAALEVLLVNNAIASYVREGKTHQIPMAMQTGGKVGMVELQAALMRLVREELVSAEEAYSKAVDRDGIARECARFGIPLKLPSSADAAESAEVRPAAAAPPAPSPAPPTGAAGTFARQPAPPPTGATPVRPAAVPTGAMATGTIRQPSPGPAAAPAPTVDTKKRGGWFG